ncbi:MAG: glutathione S-transferase family protein [Gammaproteobacteria bacterium]|nr:glutathione S-transferase family protein [Gammaproteobacteria bacterium]NIV49679.1 glutathione S-transferase family protein [Gammaproteobacteria bacterium]NIW57077.1 glutathione S-transferase family protein [Gammaproteobacteria bacterium]
MLTLYDNLDSGNAYKVRLVLAHLGLPFTRVELDTDKGATRTPEYLAKNPNGKVPALELETGDVLWESNAILFYLAEGSTLLPEKALDRARVLQWMFFEQYSHEPYIAVSRHVLKHLELTDERRALVASKREPGYRALGVMEAHLTGRSFFVAEQFSIADVALYAYTHVAEEGGFELTDFSAVRSWLGCVSAQPGHVPITQG